MENKTRQFKEAAKRTIGILEKQNADKKLIQGYKDWAEGKCHTCDESLEIVSFTKTGSGAKWQFRCGHSLHIISLEEATKLEEGYEVSEMGITATTEQSTVARLAGIQMSKENRELAVVKLLCNYEKPELVNFKNDVQYSPIDVIGSTSDGRYEFFQVTKLYDESFWHKLGKNKNVNTILTDISSLIQSAIVRKISYDTGAKRKITLVIDTWPGVMSELAQRATNLSVIVDAGFKEIWLAGSLPETTFKLFPLS